MSWGFFQMKYRFLGRLAESNLFVVDLYRFICRFSQGLIIMAYEKTK